MKRQTFKNNKKFFSVYFNCLPKRVAEGCIYFLAGNAVVALDVETGRARITTSCCKSKNGEYLKRQFVNK